MTWDDATRTAGQLLLPGDLPVQDERLPRFIDGAAFPKVLVASRADDDPLVRLVVELLARPGCAWASSGA